MVVLYYTFSLSLLIAGKALYSLKGGKLPKSVGTLLLRLGIFLFLFELLSLGVLYLKNDHLLYTEPINDNYKLFKADEELVGINRSDVSLVHRGVMITHNSKGLRGPEIKKGNERRIICVGGSTTYGVGVNDNETWPYYLDSLLGKGWEVLNYGIPGHSSKEHLGLITNRISEFDPDLVLIHAGLNDLRNSHVQGVEDVYTDFNAPTMFGSLGLCPLEKMPKLAALRMIVAALQKIGAMPTCLYHSASYYGEVQNRVDEALRKRYEQYLQYGIERLRHRNVKCFLIPQVANSKSFYDGNYQWWAPYLSDSAIKPSIDSFNKSMANVSRITATPVVDTLTKIKWSTNYFSDPSHLNASGNLKFAEILAIKIKSKYD